MAEFSDCYFCGTVTADLEEYPVIPPETDPPDPRQHTVTVCPTCREKLDRVIDPVVAHLGGLEQATESDGRDGETTEQEAKATAVDTDHTGGGTDAGGGPDVDAGGRDGSGDASEFTPESRRILRLLDNREFPVDREEIITVATNAYGVAHAEAGAVLDLLIEHGELTEEDGTLYRPE
jgi:hypothetical protein